MISELFISFIVGRACEDSIGLIEAYRKKRIVSMEVERCCKKHIEISPAIEYRLKAYLKDERNIAIVLADPKPLDRICPNEFTEDEKGRLNAMLRQFAMSISENKRLIDAIFPAVITEIAISVASIKGTVEDTNEVSHEIRDELRKITDPDMFKIPNNVPYPIPNLVGREAELMELSNKLERHGAVVVRGMGGIGKTELCLKYASSFEGPKVLVDYDGVSLRSSIAGLSGMFDPRVVDPEANKDMKYRSILRLLKRDASLIIVDNFNVDSDEAMRDICCAPVKALFTSRIDIRNYAQVLLTELPEDEQMNLFRQERYGDERQIEDEGTVREIIKRMDGHTMAIVLIANFLREDSIPPLRLLNMLKADPLDNIGMEFEAVKDGKRGYGRLYSHISRLFGMSGMSDDDTYVLTNASVISSSVGEDLFVSLLSKNGLDLDAIKASVNRLIRRGWIRKDEMVDGGRQLYIHPLVADVVHLTTKPTLDDCRMMFLNARSLINTTDVKERGILYDLLIICEDCLRLPSGDDKSDSYAFLADGFLGLGFIEKALEYHHMALGVQASLFGKESLSVALSYSKIGSILHTKGDLDGALENHNKALNIQESLLGKDHPNVATSYDNIGLVLHSMGDYERALECNDRALNIQESLLGKDHPNVAISYDNIGLVLHSMGDYERALENRERALAIRLARLGKAHPDVATSYNNIGGVYNSMGDYEMALGYYDEALSIWLSLFSEMHPNVALSYNNIGEVCHSKGDLDGALEYHEMALRIRRALFGERHPDVAISYDNIGSAFYSKGDLDGALENHERALKIQTSLFGKENLHVAISHNNIGVVCHSKGDLDGALENHERALAIRLAILGERHSDVAVSYNNIGTVQFHKGDLDEALRCLRRALAIRLAILGKGHFETRASMEVYELVLNIKKNNPNGSK